MNQFAVSTPLSVSEAGNKRSRRAGAKWTRSGCLTCKKRRKRCDEAKPSCRNCVRLGFTCEGYGSMWAEPLDPSAQVFQSTMAPKRRRLSASSLSVCSPISQESPRSAPSVSRASSCVSSALNSGSSEAHSPVTRIGGFNETEDATSDPVHVKDLCVASPKPRGHISHLSTLETHYLQYHMEQGSKLLANLESDENPLRSLIIPRAFSSPLLMKALCAVSAVHLANRSQNSLDAQAAAANYYIRTMTGLRSALTQLPHKTFPDESILAVALLCKYEIVRGSVNQWAVHLDALEKLVISRGGFASFDKETAEFIWGLFLYAHSVAKITNRRQLTPIPGAENLSLTKLDSYIGYTEEIIKICARIADLPLLGHDPIALGLEIHTIDMSLRDWTHTATHYTVPRGTTEATLLRLRMVAECFRDAAYIYLHSSLNRMSQDLATQCLPSSWPDLITISKYEALERCLERIKSFPLDQHCEYSALTFPLFITGCESQEPEARNLVIESLTKLEVNFGIGNVKRAKELLKILWHGAQMHWLDVLERLKWGLILA
ncbi:C6 transcription factor [Aspergillus steynii IBT 23096]|uniref:C6 transcription factor n=1 Tax=Aspergillus steynii IBT 23096 TaxID=1392250 RepID=A0A2I2GN01_9EURO|nr:C6 transcription factor [Aspergillus steynii IBT 23096]PLB54254.1 C6 transcription factor [Aspergillus steynii IBT 23096]